MIHKIKALYDEGKGLKIRAIARQLGISRNTVRKYLGMTVEDVHKQQSTPGRSKQLDEHRDYIIHLLGTFPGLSAVKVLRKLKAKHPSLAASDRTARRYINELKETVSLKQKRYYEPVLDMVPGAQCQVDGGELRGLMVGGVETVIYFVVFVLSYSRLMYVGLSHKPVDTRAFIQMHDGALRYFGGCPEECVYDQAKLVVINEQYRELDLNQQFHAYATAAGFRIHACEGYDPESKGKVEAGVKYVKNNALYGETFTDWHHLESYMEHWLSEVANVRCHGVTGEAPRLRYERDERAHMRPYMTPSYLSQGLSGCETRKVDKTGLLSWKSNKYSVPMAWQQARVGVREEGSQLLISEQETGQEIARHRLSQGKGEIIKNNDHYRNKQEQIAELEIHIQQGVGEHPGKRLCELLRQSNSRIYKDQLVGLRALLKRFEMPPALLVQLCDRPRLATRQIRDYLEAYYAHPERFESPPPQAKASPPAPLSPYGAITQPHQEVDHAELR